MTEEIGRSKYVLEVDRSKFERDLDLAEKKAGRVADTIGSKFTKMGKTFGAAGKMLTIGLTAPIVGIGGFSFKAALDFEKSMNKIRFLTNVTAEEMPAIEEAIFDVAEETASLPTDVASSFYFALSSGADTAAQAQAVLTPTIFAATMGLGAQEDVTRAVLGVLSAYNLELTDATVITGQFVEMVESGLAEPDELANSLSRVLAPAKALKVEFPQVGAGIAALTVLAGTTGPKAIGMFQRALISLTRFSPRQQKMLEDTGHTMEELFELIQTDFGAAMMFVNEAFDGSFPRIKKFMGSIEGTTAVLNIGSKEGLELYQASLENMTEAGPDMVKRIEEFTETNEFAMKSLRSSFSVAMIELGRGLVPVLIPIVKIFRKFSKGVGILGRLFAGLPKPVKFAVVGFLLLLAALGPVLVIVGLLMGAIAPLITMLALTKIAGIGAGIGLLATAKGALIATGSLLLLAVVVAALAIGAILLMENYEKVGELFRKLFTLVAETGFKAMKGLQEGFVQGARIVLRTIANFVKAAIRILNPYNWVFGSNLVETFRRIAMQAGVAYQNEMVAAWVRSGSIASASTRDMVSDVSDTLQELPDVADEVGEGMGQSLARGFDQSLLDMRDMVRELRGEVQRLAGLETVESVAEDLERAVLELEALDLEGAAEKSVEARDSEVESINDKIEALRDEKDAMSESMEMMEDQGLLGEEDAKQLKVQMKAKRRDIDREIKSLEKRRKEVKKQRSPEEKRLELIELEIKQLDILSRRRDLERELIELRGKVADATLSTDEEVLVALGKMVPLIESVTTAINKQAGDLWTRFIPAWEDAAGAGAGGASAFEEQMELLKGLEEIDLEDFTPDIDAILDEAKEKLVSWFDDNKFKFVAAGVGAIIGGIIGGIVGGPLGIGAGAIIGAGIGTVVGHAIDKWGDEAWEGIKSFFSEFIPTSSANAIATIAGGVIGGLIMGPLGIPVGAYLGSKFGTKAAGKALSWIGATWRSITGFLSSFLPRSTGAAIAAIAGGIIGGLIMGPLGIPVGAALGARFGMTVARKVGEWVGQIWDVLKDAVSLSGDFLGSLMDIGKEIGKAIWEGIKNGLGDLGDWILEKIAEKIPGAGAVGGLFGWAKDRITGRQEGGPVRAGEPAWVGEAGVAELFIPNRSGRIIPMEDLIAAGKAAAGGGGPLATFEFNLTEGDDWDETKRKIMGFVEEKLDETAARTNLARRRFATLGTGAPRGR